MEDGPETMDHVEIAGGITNHDCRDDATMQAALTDSGASSGEVGQFWDHGSSYFPRGQMCED